MKKHLRHWAIAIAGAAAALAFTSCAYDPYYSSVGGSYSSGYGEGYGYGGSGFSTSVFVGTGDPRWGYDPNCYSYYDYHRRAYYDPYLNGYYPIGYRPPIVYGCPHPYGYRRGYCPPPSSIHNVTVVNYRNREAAYRSTNYGWAKQVRQQPNRVEDHHPSRNGGNSYNRPNDSHSSNNYSNYGRQQENRGSYYQGGVKPGVREKQGGRLPSSYNTPVNHGSSGRYDSGQRKMESHKQPRQSQQPSYNKGGNRNSPPASHGGGNQRRQEESRPAKNGKRDVRGLGQG